MYKYSDSLALLINLAKFQTAMARRLDAALGGLSLNEFIILSELAQADGKLRRIDLAERIGLTASGVTRLLLPMEKIGLVRKEVNKEDARSSFVIIAAGGKRSLEEAVERAEQFCEEIFPVADSGSLEDFSRFLSRLSGINAAVGAMYTHAREAKQKWGETDMYKQSQEKAKKLTKADWERINADNEILLKKIVAAMPQGATSEEVQKLIAEHYDRLRIFYEPNVIMYRGLGNMYVEDPRFSAYYEKYQTGLAQFMKEAINIFCDRQKK